VCDGVGRWKRKYIDTHNLYILEIGQDSTRLVWAPPAKRASNEQMKDAIVGQLKSLIVSTVNSAEIEARSPTPCFRSRYCVERSCHLRLITSYLLPTFGVPLDNFTGSFR
jgi:hypothetical protein